MRVISKHGEYGIQISPMRGKGMGDGSYQVTQEPVYAKFNPDGVIFENEIERAEKLFEFNGRYQHVDEATPVDIDYRLSLLDTNEQGWDEQTRLMVEAELRRKEPITGAFFISEARPLNAPFPAWDTSDKPAFKLVADLAEMGFDLQEALDYERAYGPRRENVIEALEETLLDRQQETVEA
jgi:hypothetical protein